MEIAFFSLSLSYCLFVQDDEVRRIGFKKSTYLPKKKKSVHIKILIIRLSLSITLLFINQFKLKFMANFFFFSSSNYSSRVNMLFLLTSFVSVIWKKENVHLRKKPYLLH